MSEAHRFRALRNLFIIALLLAFLWFLGGCPLPTLAMEMHRAERQRIAEESQILWRYDGIQAGDRDILVGITADAVHTYAENRGVQIWPRNGDTPTLVILPERTRYYNKGSFLGPAFLAIDVPAQAETARLSITYREESGARLDYVIQGQKQEGVFFFQMEAQHQYAENDLFALENGFFFSLLQFEDPGKAYSYILEFFDAGGNTMQTLSNST